MTKKNPAGSPVLIPGALGKPQHKYIEENYGELSHEEMAAHLQKKVSVIRTYIAKLPVIEKQIEQGDWVSRLQATPFWLEMKKSLMDNEVNFFQTQWAALCSQFSSSGDILATDEMGIKDLIISDIFSMRANEEKAKNLKFILELEKKIRKEEQEDEDLRDKDQIKSYRDQIHTAQIANTSLTKEYLDYQKEKKDKNKELKGSRDQRLKHFTESGKTLFDMLKDLDTLPSRQAEGRISKKVFEAAQVVKHDWSQIMEYEDGTLDKPFLSPEGELEDARIQNEQEQAARKNES